LNAYQRRQGWQRKPTKARPNADGSTGGKSAYRLGRDFERSIRGRLERRGYFVIRAQGSKGHKLVLPNGEKAHSKLDELAVKTTTTIVERGQYGAREVQTHIVLGVQCKRRGDIGSTEWNELFDVCAAFGITPVVATKPFETGKDSVAFYRLDDRRVPRKPGRPWTAIDIATGEPLPIQTALL
jgi:hypothetical protein